LVRFITNDEPQQAKRARASIDSNDISVTVTVLLESEWVLRVAYGFATGQILQAFRNVLGLPRAHVEAADKVEQAFKWCASVLGFADALYAAFSGPAEKFATFDEKLVRRAKKISEMPAQAV
jgi:predicted nucleic-acid-binding protein